jgi:TetR/AcrR family transcriptional regulator, regulator of cefoperazone and chloramphenicol sensitivity
MRVMRAGTVSSSTVGQKPVRPSAARSRAARQVPTRPADGPDQETRARLLDAAERLFADRGFKRVTIREISRAARANVAAVNYHFGGKVGLYREVLQSAIDAMRSTNDAARDAGDGQAPEGQLRRYISIFVHRLLSPGHERVHRLITREINDPTPALDALVEQGVRPRVDYLTSVIGRMIGRPATDPEVIRCVASIQSQSIAYLPNPVAKRLGLAFTPTPPQIDEVAKHIAEFSVAGVYAIARPLKRRLCGVRSLKPDTTRSGDVPGRGRP